MRKSLAGKLIRLAHLIYPPQVTESFVYRQYEASELPPVTRVAGGGGGAAGRFGGVSSFGPYIVGVPGEPRGMN